MCILGGNRWWRNYLGPCHKYERPESTSQLPGSILTQSYLLGGIFREQTSRWEFSLFLVSKKKKRLPKQCTCKDRIALFFLLLLCSSHYFLTFSVTWLVYCLLPKADFCCSIHLSVSPQCLGVGSREEGCRGTGHCQEFQGMEGCPTVCPKLSGFRISRLAGQLKTSRLELED